MNDGAFFEQRRAAANRLAIERGAVDLRVKDEETRNVRVALLRRHIQMAIDTAPNAFPVGTDAAVLADITADIIAARWGG